MKQVIITKGLPASGKSTWAKQFVKDQPKNTWVRINRDELRAMLGSEWCKGFEKMVRDVRNQVMSIALSAQQSVVIDDTNLSPDNIERLRAIAKSYGVTPEYKIFDTSLETCIARDYKRDKPVGELVIREMYQRWHKDNEWLSNDTKVHNEA